VRDEAGLDRGDEIIVIAAGPGRIVLTTRAAIQDEVWAAAPAGDEITNMRAARAADNDAVAARRRRTKARTATTSDAAAERIGAALLTRFGV
jgi:hypothetical protein